MSITAAYLSNSARREPGDYGPEMSRRARGVPLWAALLSLGRAGIAELIDRTCGHAQTFSRRLRDLGYEILNDVVINQVLVSFGSPEMTRRVIAGIQEDGVCWCGATEWQGRTAMRISVSSWATTAEDVDKAIDAIHRVARGTRY
jgi:glutamate/tyrosine decarboxylase-like PLP-dependent enzyme